LSLYPLSTPVDSAPQAPIHLRLVVVVVVMVVVVVVMVVEVVVVVVD
jgi:hypothetical protein